MMIHRMPLFSVVSMIGALSSCVPLLTLEDAPCPCSDGYTCCDEVCRLGESCGDPPVCGNGVLDEGEQCDPGLDVACDDSSAPLTSTTCAPDCQSFTTEACERPLDLLIVVDNSGSMCEEQEALRRGLWDPLCPITDLDAIPPTYANPSPSTIESLAQTCGLMQLLALVSPSIHIGVITTDASGCDNDFGVSDIPGHPNHCGDEPQTGWGRRPQGGCLQGVVSQGTKVIRSDDENLVERIASTVTGVGTYGSAFERGLDAIELFLDDDTVRPAGCENDLTDFMREGARLAVLVITDEDDCSHDVDGPFGNEDAEEMCASDFGQISSISPSSCYTAPELLRSVDDTAAFLRATKGNPDLVNMLFLGGVMKGDDGYEPLGCRMQSGVPTSDCTPSFGSSNVTTSNATCNPEVLAAEGLPPCCEADGAPRYHALVESFEERGYMSSICVDQIANAVRDVGLFLAAQGQPQVVE